MRGLTILAHPMPVSHRRAHAEVLALVRAHRPVLVLGFGVAERRSTVQVERVARRRLGDRLDVDGERLALPRGPRVSSATVDCERLAGALDAELSDDAGDYVCNAWLYRMLRAGRRAPPVGFVHVPPEGLEAERLLAGLDRYLAETP